MLHIIVGNIMQFVREYLLASAVEAFFLTTLFYVERRYLHRKMRRTPSRQMGRNLQGSMITVFVFSTYLFMLLYITLLSRVPGSAYGISLRMFRIFSEDVWDRILAIENILMFIPLGILLPLVWSRFHSFKWCISAGAAVSLVIEIVQYLTRRGFSETDDFLNNVIGTMLGYGTLTLLRTILGKLKTRRKDI